ncbi:UNVERIFIED_CONTAM: hypothetical protein Slati_4469400 [Sesamum latifolium]|uniref:Uncharacterized protein n=1 Tax=Sesamum latifolium TaxID=2727402 RepID=A0AAW2SSB8_9LAMI
MSRQNKPRNYNFQIDPSAKGMRYKSWPFFLHGVKYLKRIDPTKIAADKGLPEANDGQDCYVPTTEWNPETGFHGLDEEQPQSYNMNYDSTVNSSSATKRTMTS